MTFIASVVAVNGVAVIADSLVTSFEVVMEFGAFHKYVESKKNADGTVSLDPKELNGLFQSKASHTKNYEEKLFKYDQYTVITTAGSARINGKKISDIIEELNHINSTDDAFKHKTIDEKIKTFVDFVSQNIKTHLETSQRFGGTVFIYSNYNKDTHKASLYKITFKRVIRKDLETDPDFKLYEIELQPDHFRVVCEGQNRIAEKILLGDWDTVTSLIPNVVNQVMKDHDLTITDPGAYYISVFEKLQASGDFKLISDDMKMFQFSPLSLQQAIDLACLLMRLEMDIQQYTKNVPTVGGLVKLAVINKDGVKFVTGEKITKPEYIR